MVQPVVTIQVVGWNSAADLPATCRALSRLPQEQVVIRYIDNASTDNSVEIVQELLPQADIIELSQNEGFAGAHNEAFARCTTPYVLTHDPDLELEWAGLQRLLMLMKTNSKVGAAQGKLVRREQGPAGEPLIDSTGIVMSRSLNGQERGASELDEGQYEDEVMVDAVTGACALYRVAALRDVAHSATEIFDADFFAYKEDVDLGWRLRRAGWQVWYVPVLTGVHRRTLGRRGVFNWGVAPVSVYQRLRSPRTRYSLRNWVWMIIKNATGRELMMHGLFIKLRILTLFMMSWLYPPLLLVWVEIGRGVPRMRAKRDRR